MRWHPEGQHIRRLVVLQCFKNEEQSIHSCYKDRKKLEYIVGAGSRVHSGVIEWYLSEACGEPEAR
jgi:hypothetical protein